jgi:Uncharacterised nucleotidyltransferase
MTLPLGGANLIAVLRNPTLVQDFGEAAWSSLIASARKANMLGALAERLQSTNATVSRQAARHLNGARHLSGRQRQSVIWEVHQLQRALAPLELPIMLLKGAAYVVSQDQIALGRLFGDIDILVPRARIGDIEQQLMLHGWISAKTNAYDQRYYRQWMHEIPPLTHMRRGTVLDVHHTILPLTARNAPDPAQIMARSRPTTIAGLDSIRVPCPEDLAIHSIVHLVHEGELHNGLRDLRDIDSMLRLFGSVDGFWKRFGEYAAGNDLAQPVNLGLHLANRIFHTPIPEDLLAHLSESSSNGRPARWLLHTYRSALQVDVHNPRQGIRDFSRWLIYVRSHALRMPPMLLARHLSTKAWMGWRDGMRDSNKK